MDVVAFLAIFIVAMWAAISTVFAQGATLHAFAMFLFAIGAYCAMFERRLGRRTSFFLSIGFLVSSFVDFTSVDHTFGHVGGLMGIILGVVAFVKWRAECKVVGSDLKLKVTTPEPLIVPPSVPEAKTEVTSPPIEIVPPEATVPQPLEQAVPVESLIETLKRVSGRPFPESFEYPAATAELDHIDNVDDVEVALDKVDGALANARDVFAEKAIAVETQAVEVVKNKPKKQRKRKAVEITAPVASTKPKKPRKPRG